MKSMVAYSSIQVRWGWGYWGFGGWRHRGWLARSWERTQEPAAFAFGYHRPYYGYHWRRWRDWESGDFVSPGSGCISLAEIWRESVTLHAGIQSLIGASRNHRPGSFRS